MTYKQKVKSSRDTRIAKNLFALSKHKSKEFRKGIAIGILGGTNDPKARKYAYNKLKKLEKEDDPATEQEDRMIKSHFGRNFERED